MPITMDPWLSCTPRSRKSIRPYTSLSTKCQRLSIDSPVQPSISLLAARTTWWVEPPRRGLPPLRRNKRRSRYDHVDQSIYVGAVVMKVSHPYVFLWSHHTRARSSANYYGLRSTRGRRSGTVCSPTDIRAYEVAARLQTLEVIRKFHPEPVL